MGDLFTTSIRNLLFATAFLVVVTACVPAATPTIEVALQAALPTPTAEPTFTPSPLPTSTPQPSPTATPAEPTPTPTPVSVALSGRILDQGTNQPVADATVRVGAAAATTDAEGRYTLTDLPPGQFVLSVTHPDYDPGLSSIFTLTAGQEPSLDLALYAPDTSPYPKDPMLTNPLDPNGAPTAKDAERLARSQGLTEEVTKVGETKLRGTYLVNYQRGGEVRAAVANLDHDAWALTDQAGQTWWIIKVCGNLARLVPANVAIATPQPRSLPLLAEVLADGVSVRACASETCAGVSTLTQGEQVEVFGCLADGGWCQVGLPDGKRGWCTGWSLRQLAVAEAIPVVQAVLPTPSLRITVIKEGRIAFLSDRDHLNEQHPSFELYLMDPIGNQQTRITTEGLFYDGYSLSWIPGYQALFYEYGSYRLGLVNPLDGSLVAWQFPVSESGSFIDLSPDGKKFAYVQRETGHTYWGIIVVNTDGTDYRQLTDSVEDVLASYPNWSPGGDKLAFGVQDSRPGQTLHTFWVMKADGSEKVKLADVFARLSAWSPSGDIIAFECYAPGTTQSGHQDICVINSDGTNLVSLTRNQTAWNPTWSPDGKQIAFEVWTRKNGGFGFEQQVYVINADGTGLTQLTFEGNNCCPAWLR